MHHHDRPNKCFIRRFSLIGIFAVLGYLILPATGSLAATTAAHASAAVSYHVTRGHAARIGASSRGVSGLHAVSQAPGAQSRSTLVPFRSPGGTSPAARAGRAQAPAISADALTGTRPAPSARGRPAPPASHS